MPKVHKPDNPIRPILSAIGTHNYNLSKFLISFLNPWSTNEYTVKNSFSFVEEITDMPNNSYYMASFDIKSLYTNVPIKETINIILDLAFPANDLFQKFDRASFKKLLEITLLDSYFVFNGKLYNQLDGLAMGSPVILKLLCNLCRNNRTFT